MHRPAPPKFDSSLYAPTAHYAQYFTRHTDPQTKAVEYTFDWMQLKAIHKSFVDSIIVELCLPDSPIPKPILIQLLGEATEESPKDAKRFSQALWDAIGDLSVGSKKITRSSGDMHSHTPADGRGTYPAEHCRVAVHA